MQEVSLGNEPSESYLKQNVYILLYNNGYKYLLTRSVVKLYKFEIT